MNQAKPDLLTILQPSSLNNTEIMTNDTAVVTEINGNHHHGEDVSDNNIVSDKLTEKVKTAVEVKRLEVNPKYKLLWPTPRVVEQLEGKELSFTMRRYKRGWQHWLF